MPTYDYECGSCGARTEVFHDMTDTPAVTCSACGGEMRRLIGAGAGFIVRGSGGRINPTRCGHSAPCCGGDSPCESPTCMR